MCPGCLVPFTRPNMKISKSCRDAIPFLAEVSELDTVPEPPRKVPRVEARAFCM